MEPGKRHYQIFPLVEPPQGLYGAIMRRVDELERRGARARVAAFGGVAVVCGLALVPVVQYTLQQFAVSGFNDYFSLLFADHTLVFTYWREFAMSLMESLPSIALLLLIPLCAALWWSLKGAWRGAQAFRVSHTF